MSRFPEISFDEQLKSSTSETSFVLRPSSISGVGVFARHGIRKGTFLDLFPEDKTRCISLKEAHMDAALLQFCEVYGVKVGNVYWVSNSFAQQSVGWYLNHSETPNAYHEEWQYFAVTNIRAGEEITIDYEKLSDNPEENLKRV